MSSSARVLRAKLEEGRWALDEEDLVEVVDVLKGGGLVVYPTDTLYGLGADPYDPDAVSRLYQVKRRPVEEPVAVIVAGLDEAQRLVRLNPSALELWRAFMPGPLTLILEAGQEAPPPPIARAGTIGIRMPGHNVPLEIAAEFGPFTATSANVHGEPSPRTVEEARAQLRDEVDLYIDAGPCPIGTGSTVVDLTGGQVTIKREGALTREELERHG